MPRPQSGSVRAIALVGAAGAGKTTLLEAMLYASGEIPRQGSVDEKSSVGDASPEARAKGHSVEPNVATFTFMGDRYSIVDLPGSTEFSAAADFVLPAVDLAIVVVDSHAERAGLLTPTFKALERLGVPHAVFVNKIDQARGPLDELTQALGAASSTPVVARQIPLIEGEHVTGFVDLALERAFIYQPGKPSRQVDLPSDIAQLEADARFHMLEQLADFDDELMEQLLSDIVPSQDAVFTDLVREMNEGLITPVFFGSAMNGFGVRRLLKALRHETPDVSQAAGRLGITGPAAQVFRVSYAGQAGKLAYLRVMDGTLKDGEELTASSGDKTRAGGLFSVSGANTKKVASAARGEIAAVAKVDAAHAGDVLSMDGKVRPRLQVDEFLPLYALSVAPKDRKDDVRLSAALAKLIEEDPTLRLTPDPETHEMVLSGQGETHLTTTFDRLKRRFQVEVVTSRPRIAYRESIRGSVTHHARHKKQSGGHGQFADVVVEIKPGAKGSGFTFSHRITGGVVPKQWIPAVEEGAREALARGPLGFPVTDVEVVLTDGSYHAVDSSEMAFKTAGRMALVDGLKTCNPYLMEPIEKLTITAPSSSTSKITASVSAHRGQILGFRPREGWKGWDEIEVNLPQFERQAFIFELRGLTQGLGSFTTQLDHMQELTGRLADEVVNRERAAA